MSLKMPDKNYDVMDSKGKGFISNYVPEYDRMHGRLGHLPRIANTGNGHLGKKGTFCDGQFVHKTQASHSIDQGIIGKTV